MAPSTDADSIPAPPPEAIREEPHAQNGTRWFLRTTAMSLAAGPVLGAAKFVGAGMLGGSVPLGIAVALLAPLTLALVALWAVMTRVSRRAGVSDAHPELLAAALIFIGNVAWILPSEVGLPLRGPAWLMALDTVLNALPAVAATALIAFPAPARRAVVAALIVLLIAGAGAMHARFNRTAADSALADIGPVPRAWVRLVNLPGYTAQLFTYANGTLTVDYAPPRGQSAFTTTPAAVLTINTAPSASPCVAKTVPGYRDLADQCSYSGDLGDWLMTSNTGSCADIERAGGLQLSLAAAQCTPTMNEAIQIAMHASNAGFPLATDRQILDRTPIL